MAKRTISKYFHFRHIGLYPLPVHVFVLYPLPRVFGNLASFVLTRVKLALLLEGFCSRLANHHLAVPFLRPFLPGVAPPPPPGPVAVRAAEEARRQRRDRDKINRETSASSSPLSQSSLTHSGPAEELGKADCAENPAAAARPSGCNADGEKGSTAVAACDAVATPSRASSSSSTSITPAAVSADLASAVDGDACTRRTRSSSGSSSTSNGEASSAAGSTPLSSGVADGLAIVNGNTPTRSAVGASTPATTTTSAEAATVGSQDVGQADRGKRVKRAASGTAATPAPGNKSVVAPSSEPKNPAKGSTDSGAVVAEVPAAAAAATLARRVSKGVEGNGAALSSGKGRGGCASSVPAMVVKGNAAAAAGAGYEEDLVVHGEFHSFRWSSGGEERAVRLSETQRDSARARGGGDVCVSLLFLFFAANRFTIPVPGYLSRYEDMHLLPGGIFLPRSVFMCTLLLV